MTMIILLVILQKKAIMIIVTVNDNEIILIILSGIASLGRAGDWICFLSIADHRVQGRHLVLKGTGGDKMEDVYACCVSLLL